MSKVKEAVWAEASEQSYLDESALTEASTIKGDLGLDSLTVTDMVLGLEDRLETDIKDDVWGSIMAAETLGEVVEILEGHING